MSQPALAAYRHVVRAIGVAFKGDMEMLMAASMQARIQFDLNRDLALGSAEQIKAIEHAEGVSTVLRQNVVQGQVAAADRYKLNIHNEIERGDNESIKVAPKGKIDRKVKCSP